MDAREFKQRFMPFHRRLYRVGYHLTGNAQDAEDLLQDTYLKLWQKRDDLREEAMTEAYLVTLMQNLYRDQRRLKRIDTSADLDKAEPPDEQCLDRHDGTIPTGGVDPRGVNTAQTSTDNYRVIKGGAYNGEQAYRCGNRGKDHQTYNVRPTGFRVCLYPDFSL